MAQIFPEVTCGALIFNKEGKILLVKSHKWRDKYVMPGGHVELGETIEQTIVRECREETGLDVYNPQFICWQQAISDNSFYKRRHYVFFDYACQTDQTEVTLNDEAEEYIWVDIKEALKMPIEAYTKHALQEYLKKK